MSYNWCIEDHQSRTPESNCIRVCRWWACTTRIRTQLGPGEILMACDGVDARPCFCLLDIFHIWCIYVMFWLAIFFYFPASAYVLVFCCSEQSLFPFGCTFQMFSLKVFLIKHGEHFQFTDFLKKKVLVNYLQGAWQFFLKKNIFTLKYLKIQVSRLSKTMYIQI